MDPGNIGRSMMTQEERDKVKEIIQKKIGVKKRRVDYQNPRPKPAPAGVVELLPCLPCELSLPSEFVVHPKVVD